MARKRKRNPTQLYSVTQISELFDFHPNTIRRWIHEDELRYYRKGGRGKIYIREDDIKDFLAKFYEP